MLLNQKLIEESTGKEEVGKFSKAFYALVSIVMFAAKITTVSKARRKSASLQ
jgi:hypothetical protein